MDIIDARIVAVDVLDVGYSRRNLFDLQRALEVAQRGRCGICGELLGSRRDINNDHVWPRSRGGFNGPGNLVAAHHSCNTRKGNRLPTGCEVIVLVATCARLSIPIKILEDQHDGPVRAATG